MLTSLCFLTGLVVWARATTLPSPLLVTYWGQDGYPTQQPLRAYCDLGYNGVACYQHDFDPSLTYGRVSDRARLHRPVRQRDLSYADGQRLMLDGRYFRMRHYCQ